MLVLRGLQTVAPAPTVLTIGNFDGVHLGHRALLRRLVAHAADSGLQPAVLTFEPHPREFFARHTAPTRLSTLREKLELIAEEGIALTRVCHFNARLAGLSAEDFIARVLVDSLRVKHLVIGDDFRFGAGRQGDFARLQAAGAQHGANGFTVEAMPGVTVLGERVSSSAVRQALAAGQLERAAQLLGRPYVIDGRVVQGKQLGREFGFATANIRIKHDRPPLTGVFAVEVHGLADGPHPGVANLGVRPSVDRVSRPILEVHLLDFAADLYGRHLSVRFLHKLRNEVHFPDFAALKAQIAQDVRDTRLYFKL